MTCHEEEEDDDYDEGEEGRLIVDWGMLRCGLGVGSCQTVENVSRLKKMGGVSWLASSLRTDTAKG